MRFFGFTSHATPPITILRYLLLLWSFLLANIETLQVISYLSPLLAGVKIALRSIAKPGKRRVCSEETLWGGTPVTSSCRRLGLAVGEKHREAPWIASAQRLPRPARGFAYIIFCKLYVQVLIHRTRFHYHSVRNWTPISAPCNNL